jgi:hypothetical protein
MRFASITVRATGIAGLRAARMQLIDRPMLAMSSPHYLGAP